MSRRKQAKPQQVGLDEDRPLSKSEPTVCTNRPSEVSDSEAPESAVLFYARTKQTHNNLLDQQDRSTLLSRETKENQAGNFAFFPGILLDKPEMSDQTDANSVKKACESVKTETKDQESPKTEEYPPCEKFTGSQSTSQGCNEVNFQKTQFNTSAPEFSQQEKLENEIDSETANDKPSEDGMTDGEMCWEKESSEKKLSVSNSLNQSADLSQTDNRSDEEFFDVKAENASYNGRVMKDLSENQHVTHDDLAHSSDSEKENFTAAKMMAMFGCSQEFSNAEKSHDDVTEEGKELEKIKDQVRMLQQQQMYQVQMLNYLQFQLNVMVTHPQSQQKSPPGIFPPGGVNGLQFQNMPQLLAAAASMTGSGIQGNRTPANSLFPTMAAAINQQLSSNKPGENPQQIFGCTPDMMSKNFNLSKLPNESETNPAGKSDAYNPLSSLALLQNSSKIRPSVSDVLTNHSRDNIDSDESYLKHVCRFCQKAFGSDSALQIHLRSHTGERPFKCNICANRFSTKGNLKVHFVRHKERYPHIEMNPNPVPEYLDNIPTSSGIPYGMSVIPDMLDSKDQPSGETDDGNSTSLNTKRAIELPIPYRCLDSGKYDEHVTKINADSESEKMKSDFTGRSQRSSSTFDNDSGVKENAGHPSRFSSVLVPFGNILPNGDRLEDQLPRTTTSVSPAVSDKVLRNPSSELSNESSDSAIMIQKSNNSSSETTKLQRLVEQIDRGKELEKNECHICHRILSCQSALKLHYRTHTGERPYKCDLCSRAFTTRGNLRTHYSSVHRQQLQNITSEHVGPRTSTLQCPLCGSRFMDQQSFQQHMQMHLYMHSQQQQALQLMNGQGAPIAPDYRVLGMVNGGFPANLTLDRQFSQNDAEMEQNNNESDDVFEDSPSDKKDNLKSNRHTKSLSPVATALSSNLHMKSQAQFVNDAVTSQSEMLKKASMVYPNNTSNLDEKDRQSSGAIEGALDLSRPSSNSSSSTGEPKASAPSSLSDNLASVSPTTPSGTSLNVLASLAANDATMRLNGMPTMNLSMPASVKEEMRARKMTTACEICNKPFTCQSALEIHLRSHTKERPFICRVCERGFTTKGNLKQHLLTHNITDVDEDMLESSVTSPQNGNLNSTSPPASNQTPSFGQLKRQLESSPSAAPPAKRTYPRHWCHICQKQFSSASSLQIHNRTHTGEKPFACSVCGRAFTTKGNLKVHMGTHVWGAGGSRRGRRISMDNPLISPWMQNTANTNSASAPLRPRAPPQLPAVPDQAAIYQQYAALASGLMGAKAAAAGDPRFHNNAVMNLNSAAAKLLMSNNLPGSAPGAAATDDKPLELSGKEEPNKSMAEIATEWIWKAYKKSQEQDVN